MTDQTAFERRKEGTAPEFCVYATNTLSLPKPKGLQKTSRTPGAITTLQPKAPGLRAQRPYARLGLGGQQGALRLHHAERGASSGRGGAGPGATPPSPVGPCPPAEAPPSPGSTAQRPQTKLRWLAGVLIGIKSTRQGETHCLRFHLCFHAHLRQ